MVGIDIPDNFVPVALVKSAVYGELVLLNFRFLAQRAMVVRRYAREGNNSSEVKVEVCWC